MLFHVAATHTADNCPAYMDPNDPTRVKNKEARKRYKEIAKRTGVNVRFIGFGAPEHAVFAAIEADSPLAVDLFWAETFPYKQSFRLTPVTDIDERNKES